MALVCVLRINNDSGVIVSDEAYWYLRRRKSYFISNIYNLLTREQANLLDMELVYAGVGNPNFHYEVVREFQKEISSNNLKDIKILEDLGHLVLRNYHKVLRKKIDNILRFMYGFNTSDFIRGYFNKEGKKYEINQESVKNTAKTIIDSNQKHNLTELIHRNFAAIVGFDKYYGFRGFHLNGEKAILATMSGGFEAIGAGKYGAGENFARFLNQKILDKRRKGFSPVESVVQVLLSLKRGSDYYHEAGGIPQIVILDRNSSKRVLEVTDDRAKLAYEIVTAFDWDQLDKNLTYNLIERLIFKNEDIDKIEDIMFKKAKDSEQLDKILRGYKVDLTEPEINEVKKEESEIVQKEKVKGMKVKED